MGGNACGVFNRPGSAAASLASELDREARWGATDRISRRRLSGPSDRYVLSPETHALTHWDLTRQEGISVKLVESRWGAVSSGAMPSAHSQRPRPHLFLGSLRKTSRGTPESVRCLLGRKSLKPSPG